MCEILEKMLNLWLNKRVVELDLFNIYNPFVMLSKLEVEVEKMVENLEKPCILSDFN